MTKSFGKKRPSFPRFRELFLETLQENLGQKEVDPFTNWLELGNESGRSLLLANFRDKLVEKYGLGEDLEVQPQIINLDGPVESVITQLFHVFSTMSLVEHINASILGEDYKKKYYH